MLGHGIAIGLVGLFLVSTGSADEGDLLRLAPTSANSVAIVRVREILATPRAKREGWANQQREQFLSGAVLIPPWVETVVSATKVIPGGGSRPWTVAIQQWAQDVPLAELAKQNDSTLQEIAGEKAIALRRD